MNKVLALCGLLLAIVTGCGGQAAALRQRGEGAAAKSAPPPSAVNGAAFDESAAPAAPPAAAPRAPSSMSEQGAGDAPAPTPAARELSPAPPPRERPGLGTEWGEQRESRVHDVTFARADRDRPFALAALHYNDREGVEALAAYHEAVRSREATAAGGALTVCVVDASGEPLDALHVGDRTYVMGESGQRYAIVLTNHTGRRVEAVATVDGLDVINGQPGSMQNRGYVLMPYASLTIDGFRQSQSTVAAFRFSKVRDSYAAQVGKARNVGVIGIAFFSEEGDAEEWSRAELERRDTVNPFPGSDSRFARPPR